MLKLALAAFVLLLQVALVGAAQADPVDCPPLRPDCSVEVELPGTPGSGGGGGAGDSGGGSASKCYLDGRVVDCYVSGWGWWSEADKCYWELHSPQPPPGDSSVPGYFEGALLYDGSCYWPSPDPGTGWRLVWRWFDEPPPGTPVTPETLAQRAVDSMTLLGPDIRTSVGGGTALVGAPVWLWTTDGPTRWGPNSATASVPGLSVTATATAEQIVWQMGDGTSVTCRSPGTPYDGAATTSSPTCGHTYERSSARFADHVYPLTATTTWQIVWSGGGQSGTMTRVRTSTATLSVGELQVLIGG